MCRERRIIWCEDRYRFLGANGIDRYYGREKGKLFFVYRKRGESVRRSIVQCVNLAHDWFWDARTSRLVGEAPADSTAATCHSDGGAEQREHVLFGYKEFGGIKNLSGDVSVARLRLSTGAEAFVLEPRNLREWVVSLHGGPDSFEGCEIRYGGLYRELLQSGRGIVILNYVGSMGLVKSRSVSWKNSIEADFVALCSVLSKSRIEREIGLLGVSFGGALALILSRLPEVKRTLLISPLLDLENQRVRGGEEFRQWFDSTFSDIDDRDLSFSELTTAVPGSRQSIGLIYGTRDEVLGREMYERFESKFLDHPQVQVWRHGDAHQPTRYKDVALQLNCALRFFTVSAARSESARFADGVILRAHQ